MKVIHTSGKRKRAVARATIKPGTGVLKVNNHLVTDYFASLYAGRVNEPLLLAGDASKKFDISVNVNGGGVNGQADASRLAIARALVIHDKALEEVFLKYDRNLLVADVRRNEPHKPNRSKPRAKRQKSYR
jgi:small subunit ribosomal protein S9